MKAAIVFSWIASAVTVVAIVVYYAHAAHNNIRDIANAYAVVPVFGICAVTILAISAMIALNDLHARELRYAEKES